MMNGDNNSGAHFPLDPKIFSALLTPHRSLGPTGFLILMACLGGLSFVSGIIFVSLGAWPVFGFFGLDARGTCAPLLLSPFIMPVIPNKQAAHQNARARANNPWSTA